jgi:type VI secretion system protein
MTFYVDNNWARLVKLAAALILLLVATSCSSIKAGMAAIVPFYSDNGAKLSEVSISAGASSNNSMPVTIDFVFIYNEDISKALINISGPQWFDKRSSFLKRYEQEMTVSHVEIVPFTQGFTVELPNGYEDAVKVILFANFIAEPGQYAADITLYNELHVELGNDGYQLKELNP